MQLLRVHLFSFMAGYCPMAGLAGTGANGNLRTPSVRSSVNGCSRNFPGSSCGQTPRGNFLKFGQHMRLLKVLTFPFISDSSPEAGSAKTRRNVIFRDAVRSEGKRDFSGIARQYVTKWPLQHPPGPSLGLCSSQRTRTGRFCSFRKNVDFGPTEATVARLR